MGMGMGMGLGLGNADGYREGRKRKCREVEVADDFGSVQQRVQVERVLPVEFDQARLRRRAAHGGRRRDGARAATAPQGAQCVGQHRQKRRLGC